jgi:hypothetical protein
MGRYRAPAMKNLLVSTALLALVLTGCRGFQRQDSRDTGFANALECVEVQGDMAARAADLCGRRDFQPGVHEYQEGYKAGLDCARGKGPTAAEAAAACRHGS